MCKRKQDLQASIVQGLQGFETLSPSALVQFSAASQRRHKCVSETQVRVKEMSETLARVATEGQVCVRERARQVATEKDTHKCVSESVRESVCERERDRKKRQV